MNDPMKIAADRKCEILGATINTIISALAGGIPEGEAVTADDAIDYFVMGIAAIMDNDTDLTTPLMRKKALKAIGQLLEKRHREFREFRTANNGIGWLATVFDSADGPTH